MSEGEPIRTTKESSVRLCAAAGIMGSLSFRTFPGIALLLYFKVADLGQVLIYLKFQFSSLWD
jgi:hypothetical protein